MEKWLYERIVTAKRMFNVQIEIEPRLYNMSKPSSIYIVQNRSSGTPKRKQLQLRC